MKYGPASTRMLYQSLLLIAFVLTTDPHSSLCQISRVFPAECASSIGCALQNDGIERNQSNQAAGTLSGHSMPPFSPSQRNAWNGTTEFVGCQHAAGDAEGVRSIHFLRVLQALTDEFLLKWSRTWRFIVVLDVFFVLIIKYLVLDDNYDFRPLAGDVMLDRARDQKFRSLKKLRSTPSINREHRITTKSQRNIYFRGLQ